MFLRVQNYLGPALAEKAGAIAIDDSKEDPIERIIIADLHPKHAACPVYLTQVMNQGSAAGLKCAGQPACFPR
jgi:hypothetical protein